MLSHQPNQNQNQIVDANNQAVVQVAVVQAQAVVANQVVVQVAEVAVEAVHQLQSQFQSQFQ